MNVPAGARAAFGEAFPAAAKYATILATRGVEWGLIGPREVDRIWERHVLNSLAVAQVAPARARVVDVGSGAGLPGIPLALARPDTSVVLLEPLLRRVTFLQEVVAELGLGARVTVVRGRAEEHTQTYDVVTCRALAPLPRLLAWCAPLMRRNGLLVALKGASAEAEVAEAAPDLARYHLSARVESVVPCAGAEPTTLVICARGRAAARLSSASLTVDAEVPPR